LLARGAALFVIGAGAYLLVARGDGIAERPRVGRLGAIAVFLAGAAAPLVLTCLALWAAGTFQTFWFWVFSYARYYQADPATGWSNLVRTLGAVAPSTSVVLALAAVGLGAVIRDPHRDRRTFVGAFTASALLGIMMGLQFRLHYFLLAVPALAMLSGIGLVALGGLLATQPPRALRWALPCTLGLVALAQPLYASRAVLFELGPGQISRAIYGRNPFPESVEVARYIRTRAAGDRVAVVGSEPQIYLFGPPIGDRLHLHVSADGAAAYAPAMQREMIRDRGRRATVPGVRQRDQLVDRRPGSDRTIFGGSRPISALHTVGVVDILHSRRPCIDGVTAAGYTPRSNVWLMVFERIRPQ
jgi:hypothetical protein